MSKTVTRERHTEGPSSSVKTTSYETTTTHESEYPVYRSKLAPRTTVIQRTSYSPMSTSRTVTQSYGSNMGVSPAAYTAVSALGVSNIKGSRDREKKDMQDLNERFASYIEKVRFLEAQNRRLADELDKLKSKWGKETTAIKAMYQAELDEARRLLDDAEKDKARLEIRCASLEEQIEELRTTVEEVKATRAADREKIERQNQQLSDYEAEINLLRRRLETLENDRDKDKKEIARLSEALNRARIDLDNETLQHVDAENRRQTLEEELEFLKTVHEQELKELAALAYRDTTAENREFWKNELGQCLREIQVTYDDKLDSMKGELETYYNMKIQEFRTGATRQNMETVHAKEESKKFRTQLTDLRSKIADLEARNAQLERELDALRREYDDKEREWESENSELKSEVAKLRAEMEAILKELQDLMDTKLGLELEIAAYRKLLEGEENRFNFASSVIGGLADMSAGGGGGGSGSGGSASKSGITKSEGYSVSSSMRMQSGSGSSMGGSAGGSSSSGGMSMSGGGMSGGGGMSMSGGGGGSSSSGGMSMRDSGHDGFTEEDQSLKVSQVVKGEMSAKTTYQRSAKGPVSISDCSADGKFVAVENTGRKEEALGGWKIKRVIDGSDKDAFTFDGSFKLNPGKKIKVWAAKNGRPREAASSDLFWDEAPTWGIGANITTKLCNPANEDRATHIQKTIYTS